MTKPHDGTDAMKEAMLSSYVIPKVYSAGGSMNQSI